MSAGEVRVFDFDECGVGPAEYDVANSLYLALFDLTVEHHLRTHPASAVVEQWIEVHHAEAGPVTVFEYDSIAPFLLVGDDARITQFGGSGWADEWAWTTEALTAGTKVLDSLGGIQPHLQRSLGFGDRHVG